MKNVSSYLSNYAIALIFAILATGCTREATQDQSKIHVRMPSTQQLHALSKTWGVSNPTALADINCFVVFYQGTEPINQDNTCTNVGGTTVTKPGDWFGGFAAGELATIDVTPGKDRTISIVGFKSTSAAQCLLARAGLDPNNFSNPYILGKKTQDLAVGDAAMSIDISWTGAVQIDDCTGPDFDQPGLPTINYPSVTQLVWATEPGGGTAGADFAQQPVLHIVDTNGNIVTAGPDSTAVVTLALSSGTGTISGVAITATAVGGVVNYASYAPGLSVNLAGAGKQITATKVSTSGSGGSPSVSATSDPFSIVAAAPAKLSFTTQPGGGSAGAAWAQQPVVQVEDAFGNPVASWGGGNVDLTVANNPGAESAFGTQSASGASGVATFSALYFLNAGSGYTLQASAVGLTSATSSAFNVTHGIATNIAFATQPGAAAINVPLGTQPVIHIQDSYGNVVTSGPDSTSTVSLTLNESGVLTGTTTVGAVAGVATFSGLSVDTIGSKTLTANATVNATPVNTTSSSFTIVPGPANYLGFTQQPADGIQNGAIGTLQVTAYDASSNVASSFNGAITLSLSSGVGTLNGTVTVAATAGVAMFPGITVDGFGNGFQLQASAGGVTSDTSVTFNLIPELKITPLTHVMAVNDYVGVPFTGGAPPYTYSIFSGGGTVSANGIYTAPVGPTTAVVRVSDSTGQYRDSTLTVNEGGQYVKTSVAHAGGCGITSTNKLYCWGWGVMFADQQKNSPTLVDGTEDYQQVSVGYGHVCAITNAGTLKCFGSNSTGQIGNGSTSQVNFNVPAVIDSGTQYVSVSAGSDHTCGVTQGGLLNCWGGNAQGQVGDNTTAQRTSPVTVGSGYAMVSVSEQFSCAINNSNQLFCWGRNNVNQLGTGNLTAYYIPTLIDSNMVKVSTGTSHSCAISSTLKLWCWGNNSSGKIGIGNTTTQTVPVAVDGSFDYIDVSAGASSTCAVRNDNSLYCWGNNNAGQVGTGTTGSYNVPTLIGGDAYTTVDVGYENSCAVNTAGRLKCFGRNSYGALGDGHEFFMSSPLQVDPATVFTAVDSGGKTSCGIRNTDGRILCWGDNASGQLGTGNTTASLSPILNVSTDSHSKISVGSAHACAIVNGTGDLKCWGNGGAGRLGNGGSTNQTSPIVIDSGVSYAEVSAGGLSTCGVTTAGVLKCWGTNTYGQLGNGTLTSSMVPVVIDSGVTYVSVGVGNEFACGVTTAGALKCWGKNDYYQLGNGNTTNYNTPQVTGAGYLKVYAGDMGGCAIKSDSTLNCWGWNVNFGGMGQQALPALIDGATSYASATIGYGHVCAVVSVTGALKCFGSNDEGQLGDGTKSQRSGGAPALINAGTKFSAVSGGNGHTCGVTVDGLMKCWGDGRFGALGLGISTDKRQQPSVPNQ